MSYSPDSRPHHLQQMRHIITVTIFFYDELALKCTHIYSAKHTYLNKLHQRLKIHKNKVQKIEDTTNISAGMITCSPSLPHISSLTCALEYRPVMMHHYLQIHVSEEMEEGRESMSHQYLQLRYWLCPLFSGLYFCESSDVDVIYLDRYASQNSCENAF